MFRQNRLAVARGLGLAVALCAWSVSALAEDSPQLPWQAGGSTYAIGSVSEIDLPEDYIFLDQPGTMRLMELTQNPVSGTELATVAPTSEGESWFLVFEFEDTGYVKDDEAEDLDPDAILSSIREGTKAGNEERRKRGWPTVEIQGWQEPPRYDSFTNHLSWAISARSEGHEIVNRNVRLLGRGGVMSATLVSDPMALASASRRADQLLTHFRYTEGNTYAEFNARTDKIAEYGLGALIVGGGAAALVKSGLLARFWKVIVAGAVGVAAVVRRFFRGRSATEEPITRV
ncbi:MAG: DUF2167 domain-containing protein [Myxococcota bacterium]